MRFHFTTALKIFVAGRWTARGGRPRIEAVQRRNLRHLVDIARKKSPLFQELYKNLPPSDKIVLQDLPVTKKRDLMFHFERWLTDRSLTLQQLQCHMAELSNLGKPVGNVAVFRTSGSSGEPAVIVTPELMLEFTFAVSLARLDKGMRKILKTVARAGVNVAITGGGGHFGGIGLSMLMQRIMPLLGKKLAFIPAESPIADIVDRLNKMDRIAAITTYPSMLMILVREKEAGRLTASPAIFKTAGETLTEELRSRVRSAFPEMKFPILNAYASTECFLIGAQCSQGRQHLPEDWVVLEAVDTEYRPVADGILSDTSLLTVIANETQPFIRYDLGDRIRFYSDPCPCGSPFRSFEIEGRQATLVEVRGVKLSPLVFDLEHEHAIRVQLVQTADTAFEIRLELQEGADATEVFSAIKSSVQKVMESNNLLDTEISLGDRLPQMGASGKFHEVLPLHRGV